MAADFNKPVTTDSYSNVLAEVRANDADLALGLDPATTTPANVPTNAIRWTSASSKWQKYNGTTWTDLAATYAISISGNAATATTASAAPWSGITGKPNTLSGYGIADAVPLAGGVSMTGLFSLFGNAASAMQPVPKQQMEAAIATAIAGMPGHGIARYVGNGVFTAPPGITTVYISGCGGGGGGGGGPNAGGGGGGAHSEIKYPITVVPGTQYTIVIGSGGAGGASGSNGASGTATLFGALLTLLPGGGGTTAGIGGAAGNAYATSGGAGAGQSGVDNWAGGMGGGTLFGSGGTGGVFMQYAGLAGGGFGSGGGGGAGVGNPGGSGRPGLLIVEW